MDYETLKSMDPAAVRKYGRRALMIGFEPIAPTLHAVRFHGRTNGAIGICYGIESGTVADPRVNRSVALAELAVNFEHVMHAVWSTEVQRPGWTVAWASESSVNWRELTAGVGWTHETS